MPDPADTERLSLRDKIVAGAIATVLVMIILGIFRLGIGYLFG